MNRAFVDTSAILAYLVPTDQHHDAALADFSRLRAARSVLITTSYVLLEIVWIDDELHERGLDIVIERGSRDLGLVDAVSFVVMRDLGLDVAFAFGRHFKDEGFELVQDRP